MRFGLVLPIQVQDVGLDQLFDELRVEVAAAERAGFDAVFLPEFHQSRGGALVSPLLLGAGLLQQTTSIRLGTAVLATPLHHPVRLAEDAIMLDWITRGRFVLGMGIGHQAPDFRAFGVPRERRADVFAEILDILDRCFTGEPFHVDGEFFDVAAEITPKPYTSPRPPLWFGGHSRAGLRRAARHGDMWLSDPERDASTIARLAALYRAEAQEAGRPARVGMFREAWVGDSRRECEEVWAPHALAVHRLYYNVGAYDRRLEPWVDEVRDRADFTLDRLAPGRFLYGSAGEVVDTVREWEQLTGAEYLALRLRHPGGPGHERTLEAIRRFGAEVLPSFAPAAV